MFGRTLAVTTVRTKTRPSTPEETATTEPMDFEQLSELAQKTVGTVAVTIGLVVVAVKVLSTVCNIAEDLSKKHL